MVNYPRPASKRMSAKSRKPYASSSRRSTRTLSSRSRKPFNSSTQGTNPQNAVVFRGIGFPDSLTTNLIYSESIALTPSVGTPCPYVVYKMNSCYDPNDAVGGGQPTFWDQLGEIYSRYSVLGCKLTATFSLPTQTAANIGPYLCGIEMGDGNAITSSNPNVLLASNNVTWRMIGGQDGSKSVVATYSQRSNFDKDVVGQTGGSAMSADPSYLWYAKIFATPQGIAITTPINVVLVLEYNVRVYDMKQVKDV